MSGEDIAGRWAMGIEGQSVRAPELRVLKGRVGVPGL